MAASAPTTSATASGLERYQRLVRRDPLGWMRRSLGTQFWRKQRDVIYSVRDNPLTVVRSANSTGKTYLAACLVPWWLQCYCPAYVITTSSSWIGVKRQLWPTLRAVLRHAPCQELGQRAGLHQTEWNIDDQYGAFGLSPKKPEGWGGYRTENPILVIVDEASALDQEHRDAIMALVSDPRSRVLEIGNPLRCDGPFYQAFKTDEWSKIHVSALDTPNVKTGKLVVPGLATREWVEARKREYGDGSAWYRARVLGEFPEEGEDVLIPIHMVDAATRREGEPGGRLRMGVDVARFGSDNTVIQVVRGNTALLPIVTAREDTMATVGRVRAAMGEHGVPAHEVKIDDIGLGGGVVDRLHEMDCPVVGVNVGTKPADPTRFVNLRAELAWNLRTWIRDAAVLPSDDARLLVDLAAPRVEYRSNGMALEAKDKVKARLQGRSPDRFDALMLALYEPPRFPAETILFAENILGAGGQGNVAV